MNKNILTIQQLCKKMGHDPGPLDGVMGRKTKAAIQLALDVKSVKATAGTGDLNARSHREMKGVHPDLVKVIIEASKTWEPDFIVTDGVRTLKEQRVLVKKGFSKTLNSMHRIQKTGYSHAVDLAPITNGKINWNDLKSFEDLAAHVKATAKKLGIPIKWGGDWKWRDRPHIQLRKSVYLR